MLLRRSTDIHPKELARDMRQFFNSLLGLSSSLGDLLTCASDHAIKVKDKSAALAGNIGNRPISFCNCDRPKGPEQTSKIWLNLKKPNRIAPFRDNTFQSGLPNLRTTGPKADADGFFAPQPG